MKNLFSRSRLLGRWRFSTIPNGSECVLEKLSNGISIISLNRPKQKNALGSIMLSEFKTHLDAVRQDSGYEYEFYLEAVQSASIGSIYFLQSKTLI
jgi:hypothetical protein